ncbi:LADA_0D08878g1_1 [Lachancea dasiensis]|uniref:LADA_0D08878g1_1 n=1 Tax=Lachancea dasiensis TaxID=1072105 RepID=A0A1G4J7K8_9SACH|nr:LADA_0D08878g1_1 [Lachancea dasiensis]
MEFKQLTKVDPAETLPRGSPKSDLSVKSLIDTINNLDIGNAGCTSPNRESKMLTYEEAIAKNPDISQKFLFELSYKIKLRDFHLRCGSWNDEIPLGISSIQESQILSLDWTFSAEKKAFRTHLSGKGNGSNILSQMFTLDEGPKQFDDNSFLTALVIALEKNWIIWHLPCARPKLLAGPLFIPAPPHYELPNVAFEFKPWGSYKNYCGLGYNLYNLIRDRLKLSFGMSEQSPGLFLNNDGNFKGILCLLNHEILLMGCRADKMFDIKSNLTEVLEHTKGNEGWQIIGNEHRLYRIYSMDIQYERGVCMELGMKSEIEEFSSLLQIPMGRHIKSGNSQHYKVYHSLNWAQDRRYLNEAKAFLKEVSGKCRFDIAYFVSVMDTIQESESIAPIKFFIKYLLESKELFLKWKRHKHRRVMTVDVQTDASLKSHHAHIGFNVDLNNNAISVFSGAISGACPSANEAELLAIIRSRKRLREVKNILHLLDFRVRERVITDSLAAVALLAQSWDLPRSARSLRREYVDGELKILYIRSGDNFADLLTKRIGGAHLNSLLAQHFERRSTALQN